MGFLGVYRAIYDYEAEGDDEITVNDGDVLCILEEDQGDGWWKAKKKALSEDEDEPEGLVPGNYIEKAAPIQQAKALYDYTRQTDEELSFADESILDVYDTSDPDWTLVGLNGEFGFAPANYIEPTEEAAPAMPARPRAVPEPEPEPEQQPTPPSPNSPVNSPAAALAGIIGQRTGPSASAPRATVSPPPAMPSRQPQYTPEESDQEPEPTPRLPARPPSGQLSPPTTQYASSRSPGPPGVLPSPPYNRAAPRGHDEDAPLTSPGGYHLYNIHEMVEHMGKQRKMPMTLGINIPKGMIMIAPEKSRDGPQKEWTAEKLTHYSLEGKHVFMELVRPSKSVDFHAGAKDTAHEIVASLGELAGAVRAEGLREVFTAGSSAGQKKGHMVYEFMAQGDDEVTVAVGDEVIVIDDTKSDEWWMVRRLRNGKEGVVPSSYVEITGTTGVTSPTSMSGLNSARSHVEQNRLEEERMTREAARSSRKRDSEYRGAEVGPGLQLPERHSSLRIDDNMKRQRSKRDSRLPSGGSKARPDASKTRTWTDRSGSFKVEAEFIGLKDGKIHLHKLNGVKIAVPVPKMSIEDLEYVEAKTGISLDDDKPLSNIKRRSTQKNDRGSNSRPKAGIAVEQPKRPEYDWFDFFLQCGVNPQICERYASAFTRDEMGEENMPDINPQLLRTLGLKEGDILRVMKFLDNKYGRTGTKDARNVSFGDTSVIGDDEKAETNGANGTAGGLFSGPGGSLRNNTRKGRPAPPVQTNDVVDPKAFEQKSDSTVKQEKKVENGFDDNAWEPRESKTPQQPATTPATSAPAPAPGQAPAPQPPTGTLAELSLLSPPLQPSPAPQPSPQASPAAAPAPQQAPQPTGATPGLFEKLASQPSTVNPPQQQQSMAPQPTGFGQQQPQQQQFAAPRQRPLAPQNTQGGLIAPPPGRTSSAPQNFQQGGFQPPPLQPQMTGYMAPPGQSMQELNQQRFQQNFSPQGQLQPQPTGFSPQGQQGFNQFQNGIMPQPTGYQQFPPHQFPQFQQPQQSGGGFNQSYQQAIINGQQQGSPFADTNALQRQSQFQPTMSQPTGMPNNFGQQQQQRLQPQATGINAFLPPALQPQRTGFGAQQPSGFGQPPPPVPPIPQQQSLAPLQPQKTGPPPPVRFGVQGGAKKLTPQPTGRANLSKATPQNPFGF